MKLLLQPWKVLKSLKSFKIICNMRVLKLREESSNIVSKLHNFKWTCKIFSWVLEFLRSFWRRNECSYYALHLTAIVMDFWMCIAYGMLRWAAICVNFNRDLKQSLSSEGKCPFCFCKFMLNLGHNFFRTLSSSQWYSTPVKGFNISSFYFASLSCTMWSSW